MNELSHAAIRLHTALVVGVARLREERGAAMAEYGLLLAMVALAAIGILVFFGGEIVEMFTDAEGKLDTRSGPAAPD